MNQTYVALDLETTGLKPECDSVIEVGAAKFRGDRVLDSWSSLVRPICPIPQKVQLLTGIGLKDVASAPSLAAVLPVLSQFVGELPLVGHNLAFDLSFLKQGGLTFSNIAIDTFELAGIVLPKMNSYNLGLLTAALGIPAPTQHRALADALLAKALFCALYQRALGLDLETIQEINRLASKSAWSLGGVFQEIEQEKMRYAFGGSVREHLRAKGGLDALTLSLPSPDKEQEAPLEPREETVPLDAVALAAVLDRDGIFARCFPSYEDRPQQREMLRQVAWSLNHNQHLIVEAGTGVGKSMAYLLPAVFYAVQNGRHVVISTNTINLQDQLFNKDLPDLLKVLKELEGQVNQGEHVSDFRAALVKGRANYLCLRRWVSFRHAEALSPQEVRLAAKTLAWLPTTITGDRAELTLGPEEQEPWTRICADEKSCDPATCPYFARNAWFLFRARERAEAAHIIVVNHALLLTDLGTQNRVLPEHRHLVIDEAHHLEDVATDQFGYALEYPALRAFLDSLCAPLDAKHHIGFIPELRNRFARTSAPKQLADEVAATAERLCALTDKARHSLDEFFGCLGAFMREHRGEEETNVKNAGYEQPLRLTPGVRAQPSWPGVELAWENLDRALQHLQGGLARLRSRLSDAPNLQVTDLESTLSEIDGQVLLLQQIARQFRSVVAEPSPQDIYWLTAHHQTGEVSLHAAPLNVNRLLQEKLFAQKDSVILTSATLSTEHSFDFIRERLGLEEADELLLGSPFDYRTSTLLFIPQDLPEPGKPYYQKRLEEALIALCRATQGRAMVLLTSHSALRSTYQAIVSPLEEDGIMVLGHGIDGSPRQLLDRFRANPRAVLLGTASFWEGVDVVGKALSVLVIAKLPFAVPTDPVFAARSECFDDPFGRYAVPQTVLKFKQGFGRLIRSRSDRGVVALMDRRVDSKPYGAAFLTSLPTCTVRRGPLASLPEMARAWLED